MPNHLASLCKLSNEYPHEEEQSLGANNLIAYHSFLKMMNRGQLYGESMPQRKTVNDVIPPSELNDLVTTETPIYSPPRRALCFTFFGLKCIQKLYSPQQAIERSDHCCMKLARKGSFHAAFCSKLRKQVPKQFPPAAM